MSPQSDFPHLPNAPATEAVIDVRIRPSSSADVDALKKLAPSGYKIEETRAHASEIEFTTDGPRVSHQESKNGYRFIGDDGRVVVQATLDGLAISRLQPYTEWSDLLATAKTFYQSYVKQMRPGAAVRLGVRYINRLDLPAGVRDLGRFLVAPPAGVNGTSGAITGFLERVVSAENGGMTAIVTIAIQEVYESRTVLIFDIDCALNRSFEVNDQSIWDEFATLRVKKNEIFFGNITPEARKIYE